MEEIKVKDPNDEGTKIDNSEKVYKTSRGCPCGCVCTGPEGTGKQIDDADTIWSGAYTSQNPSCGCSCHGTMSLNEVRSAAMHTAFP